jgi:hypothetical protein
MAPHLVPDTSPAKDLAVDARDDGVVNLPRTQPKNVVTFLKDGTACVVLFPYAPKLTAADRKRIDAARRVRFFVYARSDAPVPPTATDIGKTFEDHYAMENIRFAIDKSTFLGCSLPMGSVEGSAVLQASSTPATLIRALMDLDAGTDGHRRTVTIVADRHFDDVAIGRPRARVKAAR